MVSIPDPDNPYSRRLDEGSLDPNSSYAYLLELAGTPETALDVGCNTGYLGSLLMARGTKVWGVDNDTEAVAEAVGLGLEADVADLDQTPLPAVFPDRRFDVVIFADVLEHLKRPDRVLATTGEILTEGGRVLASIPNVAHGNVRLDLLLGRFEYTTIGLLDSTHLRFFTGESLDALFRDAGFTIEDLRRVQAPVDGARIAEAAETLGLAVDASELLELLSRDAAETFQYVVSARPTGKAPAKVKTFWTLGETARDATEAPRYLSVDAIPNVVTDMRQVIGGLEASLMETRTLLERTISDKNELIRGLEASLEETRQYLDQVIHDKDGVIRHLEGALTEAQAQRDAAVADRDAMVGRLEAELAGDRRRLQRLTLPSVTVVVVNWNGEHLLGECLKSLRTQSYPQERYHVVVVDNGSTDGSVREIRRSFPEVSVIEAGANLGFAAGNNLAIARSESDFVALLNNDAAADPEWLDHLVAVAMNNPMIGAVNSKVWLSDDRLDLRVDVSDVFVPGEHDPRSLGAAFCTQAMVGDREQPIEFLRGSFPSEADEHGPFRWISGSADLRIAVTDRRAGTARLRLFPAPFRPGQQPTLTIRIEGRVVVVVPLPTDAPIDLDVPFEPADVRPVVQNAGSVILPDGAGSDRGSMVMGTDVFYQSDRGQFDAVEDVPAFCGAAVLLRREALEAVGVFDSSFFMYYEDTDLSLRLRAGGWRIVLAPQATVRHRHAATSVEWSPKFCYFTERNRLLMLMKNSSGTLATREWLRYSARLLRPGETSENRARMLRVQRSLVRHLPEVMLARRNARREGKPVIALRPPETQ